MMTGSIVVSTYIQ